MESPFNPHPDPARHPRVWTYSILGREQRDVRRPKHDLVWPPLRPLFRDNNIYAYFDGFAIFSSFYLIQVIIDNNRDIEFV